ncbi:MAG: hypothetical protein ABI678_27670 [Kofleriaceae bacterium]
MRALDGADYREHTTRVLAAELVAVAVIEAARTSLLVYRLEPLSFPLASRSDHSDRRRPALLR